MPYLDSVHSIYTEAVIFSLCMAGWLCTDGDVKPYSYIQNPPHPGGLRLPGGLPFAPHTEVVSSPNPHPERDVFVFPSGLNSLPKVYVLNKIIVSPVLS